MFVRQFRTVFVYMKFLTYIIFSQHHHVATVDSQNDLSYIIQCIDMMTDLFSYQISGVIICNHESES